MDSEGRYTYTSPAVKAKILGYTTEEIIGMHFYDLCDSDEPTEGMMGVFRRKEPFISHTNINRHRDGHTVMLETTGVPVLDSDGELLGYRGVDRDATEQKNLEQRLHQTIDKLKESYEELSIPVIQAWDGVLVLPIIGVLDTDRISRLTDAMLARIVETHSGTVIIDITGVRSVDTNVANNLIDVTRSARLLGATCVITGIKPEAAHILVGLGVDMSKIITKRTLREGLAYALKVVGRG